MAWKTLHCTGHCKNLKSKVKLQLLFTGEALIPALQRFTCWPAASILMVDGGQVMPGGWKTDMGHGRTHPTDFFFKVKRDPVPMPWQPVWQRWKRESTSSS